MGKLFSGMIAAIFMAGGLTALTTGAAQAACPYTNCIDTTAHANNLNNPQVGKPARVKFRVSTAGNGDPRGVVTFTYQRAGNGQVEGRFRRAYDGGPGWDRYAFRGLPQGKYVVRVFFNSMPANSAYENCKTKFRQTVRPRA